MARWPEGRSLRRPRRSTCTGCGVAIAPRDLVPVVSYLLLRGRCRSCERTIDPRIPLLELSTALLVAATVARYGSGLRGLLLAVVVAAVALAAAIDAVHGIIPDRLTRPLAVFVVPVSLMLAAREGGAAVLRVVAWSLVLPAALYLLNRVASSLGRARPVGGGDVKLLIGVHAALALPGGSPARFLAVSLTAAGAVAALGLLTGRLQRGDRLPMGPALLVGLIVEILGWPAWLVWPGGAP